MKKNTLRQTTRPENDDKAPMDGWTFWTLVAGFVIYSGLLAFAVVWSIFH